MALELVTRNERKPWLNARCNGIKLDRYLGKRYDDSLTGGYVVQQGSGTNRSTPVTLNVPYGKVITALETVPADNVVYIEITNSYVSSGDIVNVWISNWSGAIDGSNGLPYLFVGNVLDGQVNIGLSNVSTANAIPGNANGVLEFMFEIIKNG